jgi:hypothetical protein
MKLVLFEVGSPFGLGSELANTPELRGFTGGWLKMPGGEKWLLVNMKDNLQKSYILKKENLVSLHNQDRIIQIMVGSEISMEYVQTLRDLILYSPISCDIILCRKLFEKI